MRQTAGSTTPTCSAKLDEPAAAFLFQSPNFLGVVEDSRAIAAAAHERKAYAVQVVAEAMSLAFLDSPGDAGVDMAVGEAQSFGLPLGFGGPYLGFMAAREEFLRQMPGRIVGQTVDLDGKRGYVLTLSTREQHIKREKATSNICSNEAWCAMRAGMYLATMGKAGLGQRRPRQPSERRLFRRRAPPAWHTCASSIPAISTTRCCSKCARARRPTLLARAARRKGSWPACR